MLRNSICVSEEKIVENSTFSYVLVDDPAIMPVEDDPSGTTAYFPFSTRGGLMELIEKYKAKADGCQFAVVQTNSDGIKMMIIRGADRRSVVQDAAILVFGLFGIFLNTGTLLKESRYEYDDMVWHVLPYEYNQTVLI